MSEPREKIQRQLDEALADSFPASDPVSIVTSQDEEDWGAERGEPAGAATPAPAPQPPKP
jgi:2-methylcitrate dehydratase PrpD